MIQKNLFILSLLSVVFAGCMRSTPETLITEENRNRIACDYGDPEGCFYLGELYYYDEILQNDDEILQNDEEAIRLYQFACNNGYTRGCSQLVEIGNQYENENDTSKDFESLYQVACDNGEMLGCFHLGMVYENERGVSIF